jgi:hypothetical protein
MSRYAGQMMTNAAIVLHQSDLTLSDVVIADCDHMTASLEDLEQRYLLLLTQQDPGAGHLPVMVAAVHAVAHLTRWMITSVAVLWSSLH